MAQAEIYKLMGHNGDRVSMQVADASTIAKGDICVLGDPFTVTAATTNVDVPVVGVAAEEKVANDGQIWIDVITNAILKVTVVAGGSATIGDHVSLSATAGQVDLSSSLDNEKGWSLGFSYEDGAAGHTILVRMNK